MRWLKVMPTFEHLNQGPTQTQPSLVFTLAYILRNFVAFNLSTFGLYYYFTESIQKILTKFMYVNINFSPTWSYPQNIKVEIPCLVFQIFVGTYIYKRPFQSHTIQRSLDNYSPKMPVVFF